MAYPFSCPFLFLLSRRIHIRSISQILKLKNDQVRLKMLEQECRKLDLKLRLRKAGQAENDDGGTMTGRMLRERTMIGRASGL